LSAVLSAASNARTESPSTPAVRGGATIVVLRATALSDVGLRADWGEAQSGASAGDRVLLSLAEGSRIELSGTVSQRIVQTAEFRHRERLILHGPGGEVALDGVAVRVVRGGATAQVMDVLGRPALILHELRIAVDEPGGAMLLEAGAVTLAPGAAKALGVSDAVGVNLGNIIIRAALDSSDEVADAPRAAGTACGGAEGADVIVGHLPQMSNYGSVGGVAAFAVGTTSCNIGNAELLWIYDQNRHPVIAQNMYRLKNGRFEQIGMSWLKHGFAALTGNICGCGCNDPGTSQRLGVGCSDPYSAGLNGNQFLLGPRSEVNAHTGEFQYPFTTQDLGGDAIYKRLQVAISDIDPGQGGGGTYFAEGHYVTPDDALAGNADNNASYRQMVISGSGTNWTASFTGMPNTVRGAPAIRAWKANDAGVVETDVRVPDEGLVILGARATALGGGMWHYEYAVQNLNSDRSVRAFTVPVSDAAIVQNIGFHDVDYHSGEPYDGTDWAGVRLGGAITWATGTYAVNANANALRWGSLYNFRFDADQPPQDTTVGFGLFKPGKPGTADTVFARTVGPAGVPLDCNGNGVADAADIAGGTSADCNANGLPDECDAFPALRLAALPVATGLSAPVAAAAPAGDLERLFICEQSTGRVRLIKNGVLLVAPFLDVGGVIGVGPERGLLGLAFHPQYALNGRFFVSYTNIAGQLVIARYSVSGNPDLANAASAVVLKSIATDGVLRSGGQLAFGADGMLYVGVGDGGGAAGDGLNRAQDINSLLGKVLRLDVDAPAPYIPGDNPLVGEAGLDEIWALGLRNPRRFSFDRQTGDLLLADIGESQRHEVNFTAAGAAGGVNYGWRCYEGTLPFNLAGCGAAAGYEFPHYEYSHGGGVCGIVGGYVYRGCALPQLRGTYFFADACAGWVRSFRLDAGSSQPPDAQDRTYELGALDGGVNAFGEDAAGELLLLTTGGSVYRIGPAGGSAVCGNNVVEYGEQCDDGNTSFGDGCDENCQLENNDLEFCSGAAALCADASVAGATLGAVSDGSATCGAASGSAAHWYVYLPVADGAAELATCGSDFDTVLSVHSQCPGGAGTQLACNDDACALGDGGSRVVFDVKAGEAYYVRVGGYDGDAGEYVLTVEGPGCTPICGNGVVELGEDCEPPGAAGCDAECHFNTCAHDLFIEEFEAGAPAGWTLLGAGSTATAGHWTVGDPAGTNTGGQFVQPEDAHSGSGCAFTGVNNSLHDGDVDEGVTYLVSPAYDLSGLENARVRYARWFYNGALGADSGDFFIAQASANNGGTWVTLEQLGDSVQANAWTEVAFELAPLIALTTQVRVRFGVSDGALVDDLIEGAVDAFAISTCTDCNSNGVDDGDDLASGASRDIDESGIPDECEAEGDPLLGGLLYDRWWAAVPAVLPGGDHPLWAYRPDLVSNTRAGLETWRCKECHGWDYRGVSGAYGSGSHRTGFPGIVGSTLSEADLIALLTLPPNNGGGPGVPNGHAYGQVLSPAYIRDLAAFVRLGVVDTTPHIDGGGVFLGSAVQGQTFYKTNPTGPSCRNCHGVDGTNIDFGTPLNPEWLGNIATENPWEFLHKTRFGQPGSSMPQYLAFGTNQGAADIGTYVQQNFPTQCFLNSHCDDGNACNGSETCQASGCVPGVFAGCDVGCDQDCDVDLADFAIFQRCHTGSVGPGPAAYPPGCDCYDYDADGDVDALDFAVFSGLISGTDVPAPGCAAP